MGDRGEWRSGGADRRAYRPAVEGLEGRIALTRALHHLDIPGFTTHLSIVRTGALSGTATGADGSQQTASLAGAGQAAGGSNTEYARVRGDNPRWEAEAGLGNSYVPGAISVFFDAGASLVSGAHSGTLQMTAESGTVNGDGLGTGEFITFRVSPYTVPRSLRRVAARHTDLKHALIILGAGYHTGPMEDVSSSNQIAFASYSYRGKTTRLIERNGPLVPNVSESHPIQFVVPVGGRFQVRLENYLDATLDAPAAPTPDAGGFAASGVSLTIGVAPIPRGHATHGRAGR